MMTKRVAVSVAVSVAVLTAGLVLLVAALLATVAKTQAQREPPPRDARVVRTAEVRVEQPRRSHRYPGVVRATERARVAFTLGGRVTERAVEVGDRVVAGQVLARLDGEPFRHALSARRGAFNDARARLEQTRRDVGRARALREDAVLSRVGLERSESGLESLAATRNASAAQVRLAQRSVRETTLRAPFAGLVTATFVEVHEQVTAGMPVIAMDGDGPREVEVEVSESVIGSVDEGASASVELPVRGGVFEGRVHRVGSARSGVVGLYPIIVRLSDDALIGATAEVHLEIRGGLAALVPVEAIVAPTGGQAAVFRLRDGRAERIPVEILGLYGDHVALDADPLANLAASDRVVVAGHGSLLDGEMVVSADAMQSVR